MAGGVAQTRVGGGSRRSFGRLVVDPDVGDRVDHGAGGEQVFDGESQRPVGLGGSGGDDGDAEAPAQFLLPREAPLRELGGVGERRHPRIGGNGLGTDLVDPGHDIRIHRHEGGAGGAPFEAHLVTRLIAGGCLFHGSRLAAQTEDMRVVLQLDLDAYPDDVWALLQNPLALGEVVAPLLELEPVGHRRFPPTWSRGDHLVRLRLFGILPVGDQLIRLSTSRRGDVRILEDSGGPVSGALGIISSWRHRMAVSPLPGGRTFYRDRLDISAGVLTPIVWMGTWLLWQYRALGIRRVVAARTRRT